MAVEISFSFGGVDTLGELAIWLITIPAIVIYIVRASRQFAQGNGLLRSLLWPLSFLAMFFLRM